jgi:flagella basal body P-ring formation protein FlgA
MACSIGRLALWCALAPAALAAQSPPVVSPGVARRVAAQVADAWGVEPSTLTLQWGRLAAGRARGPEEPFVLAGRGADGWFTVVFDADALGPATAVRLRAGVPDTVLVAARPLAAGAALACEDLRPDIRVHWGPPTPDARRPPEAGWEIRRPFAAGEVVAWPGAEPPWIIDTGAPVRVVWRRGGVSLVLAGVALHRARAGEPVRVRIAGRSDRLQGRATAPDTVVLGDGGNP